MTYGKFVIRYSGATVPDFHGVPGRPAVFHGGHSSAAFQRTRLLYASPPQMPSQFFRMPGKKGKQNPSCLSEPIERIVVKLKVMRQRRCQALKRLLRQARMNQDKRDHDAPSFP